MSKFISFSAFIFFLSGFLFAQDKPNIIFMMTDDQRYDAVGYTGNSVISTPALDSLAKEGLVFQQCFVSSSICCISRANIISGQYPRKHGVKDFHAYLSDQQLQKSIPNLLKKSGYQTAFFGKWGIGETPDKCNKGAKVFDYWGGQPKQTNYFHEKTCLYVKSNGFKRPIKNLCDCPPDSRGKKSYNVRIGKDNIKQPVHVDSQVIPQHVGQFLAGRNKQKPFCMMVFFKSPHGPYQDYDPVFEKIIDHKTIPRDPLATEKYAQNEPEVVKKSLGWSSGFKMANSPKLREKHIRNYYRIISSMDLGVKRIVAQLKKHGLQKNTVIMFTSDNGAMFGEHGSGGKWLMYETSLRVPGFIYDPRNPGGKVSKQMVITQDFSATILALAGVPIPQEMDGVDLMSLYSGPQKNWRRSFIYSQPYAHKGAIAATIGVRTEKHVYTRYLHSKPQYEQLFNLQKDPNQLVNLKDNPEYSKLLKELRKRCDEHQK